MLEPSTEHGSALRPRDGRRSTAFSQQPDAIARRGQTRHLPAPCDPVSRRRADEIQATTVGTIKHTVLNGVQPVVGAPGLTSSTCIDAASCKTHATAHHQQSAASPVVNSQRAEGEAGSDAAIAALWCHCDSPRCRLSQLTGQCQERFADEVQADVGLSVFCVNGVDDDAFNRQPIITLLPRGADDVNHPHGAAGPASGSKVLAAIRTRFGHCRHRGGCPSDRSFGVCLLAGEQFIRGPAAHRGGHPRRTRRCGGNRT